MSDSVIWVDFNTLEKFMTDVFIGLGVPPEEAAICSKVLITADMRGIDSHGINRLKPIYYDRIREGIQETTTNFEVVRETPTTAVIDGHNGMGHVIGTRAMRMAIDKAKKSGMGMTVVRNSTHYGIAGYYATMACDAQMIGITGTNARPSIAPTFGIENMLGTNPLVFGMPTDEPFPFCIDCATSITQRGKIEIYARSGKPLPEGWVIRSDGSSGVDSKLTLKELIDGTAALAPLGGIGEELAGYKGYGYAAVVEILSAALAGGSFLKMLSGYDGDGKKVPYNLGHFFMAIDISSFTEPVLFRKTTGDILRALRDSQRAPDAERIYTAGEKEYEAWLERKDKGVPLDKSLQKEIKTMEKELRIKGYNFPF
ncbi:MAG: Ldh family oxidoreductase [Leptospirales bacterium]|nr:Ldh family oxidoreductase [Leptospirales bacterium]